MCSITQDILQVAGEAKLKYGILSNAKILFYDACFLGHPHRFVQVRRVRCCIHTDTKRLKNVERKLHLLQVISWVQWLLNTTQKLQSNLRLLR